MKSKCRAPYSTKFGQYVNEVQGKFAFVHSSTALVAISSAWLNFSVKSVGILPESRLWDTHGYL